MRKREPSGDQCGQNAKPGKDANFLDSVPSALATYRSFPLAKSIRWPSGDQVSSWPTKSPNRCGVPAGRGNTQSGGSFSAADIEIKSAARSGEISAIRLTSKGVGISDASPPVVETW